MVEDDEACQVCGRTDGEATMLICDGCNEGYHLACLQPPLSAVPAGVWVCPNCNSEGITKHVVQSMQEMPKAAGRRIVRDLFPSAAQRRTRQTAAGLTGHTLTKEVKNPRTGRTRMLRGTLKHLGKGSGGQQMFEVRYDDGATEQMTMRTVLRHPVAATAVVQGPSTAYTLMGDMPDRWDLRDPAQLAVAFDHLMPGHRDMGTLTRLSNMMPGGPRSLQRAGQHNPGQPEWVATLPEEVMALARLIKPEALGKVFDPWCGSGTIGKSLVALGCPFVFNNDINLRWEAHWHEDALQPELYRKARIHGARSIVTSPWFKMLDLAVPLALEAVELVACLHVPGHYLYGAPEYRRDWLRELQQDGRLVIVQGLKIGPMGRPCLWLLLFKHVDCRHLVMQPWAVDQSLLFL